MSDPLDQPSPTDLAEEEATARLLRMAGTRPAVPAMRAARVRSTVRAHWQARARWRAVRRRALAAAGLVSAALLALFVLGRTVTPERAAIAPGAPVAVVERVDRAATRLQPGDSIRVGEWIETAAGARVALRFADGSSVRFDVASRARPLSANVIDLAAGALYVDTAPGSAGFEVRTPIATARDVGTQFEIRVQDAATRVRVRSGKVELRNGTRLVSGEAGTEVTMSADRAVSRPIASHGPDWEWTASVAPALDIEGLALSEFLDRLSREHGWSVRYADPALARDASAIVLHGSVSGLQPPDAVEVAITTSGLAHRLENGLLTVTRLSSAR